MLTGPAPRSRAPKALTREKSERGLGRDIPSAVEKCRVSRRLRFFVVYITGSKGDVGLKSLCARGGRTLAERALGVRSSCARSALGLPCPTVLRTAARPP